jgi:hypothetical protein
MSKQLDGWHLVTGPEHARHATTFCETSTPTTTSSCERLDAVGSSRSVAPPSLLSTAPDRPERITPATITPRAVQSPRDDAGFVTAKTVCLSLSCAMIAASADAADRLASARGPTSSGQSVESKPAVRLRAASVFRPNERLAETLAATALVWFVATAGSSNRRAAAGSTLARAMPASVMARAW